MGRSFFTLDDVLETERLTMKRLCIDDKDLIFSLRSNGEVIKFTEIKQYTSVDDAIKYIQRIDEDISNMECLMWSISLSSSREPIGTICFWNFSPDRKSTEIGYDLLPAYWGNGYTVEAMQEALSFGFSKCGFEEVIAEPRSEHANSRRVLEKSGFRLITQKKQDDGVELCFYKITKANF